MAIIISDPHLLTQLAAVPGFAELCDASGRVIGTFSLERNPLQQTSVPAQEPALESHKVFEYAANDVANDAGHGISLTELWKLRQPQQSP